VRNYTSFGLNFISLIIIIVLEYLHIDGSLFMFIKGFWIFLFGIIIFLSYNINFLWFWSTICHPHFCYFLHDAKHHKIDYASLQKLGDACVLLKTETRSYFQSVCEKFFYFQKCNLILQSKFWTSSRVISQFCFFPLAMKKYRFFLKKFIWIALSILISFSVISHTDHDCFMLKFILFQIYLLIICLLKNC
jgi:hypothetical protein